MSGPISVCMCTPIGGGLKARIRSAWLGIRSRVKKSRSRKEPDQLVPLPSFIVRCIRESRAITNIIRTYSSPFRHFSTNPSLKRVSLRLRVLGQACVSIMAATCATIGSEGIMVRNVLCFRSIATTILR